LSLARDLKIEIGSESNMSKSDGGDGIELNGTASAKQGEAASSLAVKVYQEICYTEYN
jgi:hypothetical protein